MDDDDNQGPPEEPKKMTDFARLVSSSDKTDLDKSSPVTMQSLKEAARDPAAARRAGWKDRLISTYIV